MALANDTEPARRIETPCAPFRARTADVPTSNSKIKDKTTAGFIPTFADPQWMRSAFLGVRHDRRSLLLFLPRKRRGVQQNVDRTIVSVDCGEVGFAVNVEVGGDQLVGTSDGEFYRVLKGAVAIAQEHGDVRLIGIHYCRQIGDTVTVEVRCDHGNRVQARRV